MPTAIPSRLLISRNRAEAVVRMAGPAKCCTAAVIGPSHTRLSPVGIRKIRKAMVRAARPLGSEPGMTAPTTAPEFIARMKQGTEIRKAIAGVSG
ncbi:hypothetical protein D3C80_1306880 [compost metagenome]